MEISSVTTGLENLVRHPIHDLKNRRLGLLCNPASVDRQYRHARDLIHRCYPGQLAALFSPQHGFHAEKQDNMVESDHGLDNHLQVPVYSLYGDTRIPTAAMRDTIDTLLVDLQDVGTRVYTFVYTLSYCMEAARDHGVEVVVLDRPNPVGGLILEGNCLREEFTSFVGRFPLPMRHGLTIGELARLFNEGFGIGCHLRIVPMNGWSRSMFFNDTGLPWVPPSPNLPTFQSALVYPGQVIWEGTNLSEGRGTTLPFEQFGAPFLDSETLADCLPAPFLEGVTARPVIFEPTSGKWQGQPCRGYQLHVQECRRFRPFALSLAFMAEIFRRYPQQAQFKQPGYEYDYEKKPIDLILGDDCIRRRLESGDSAAGIIACNRAALEAFERLRRPFLLY